MFITELENIYHEKPVLNKLVESKELLPNLRQFLIQEVRLGARYLNPYRFAYKFGYKVNIIIQLFVAFSQENGPLKRIYKFNCINCNELNLLDDSEIMNYSCVHCEVEGEYDNPKFLDDVSVVFEIKEKYLKATVQYLKVYPSPDNIKVTQLVYSGEESISLKSLISLSEEFKEENPGTLDDKFSDIGSSIKNKFRKGLYR